MATTTPYEHAATPIFAQKAEIVDAIVTALSSGRKINDLNKSRLHVCYLVATHLASIVTDGPNSAESWIQIEALARLGRDARDG